MAVGDGHVDIEQNQIEHLVKVPMLEGFLSLEESFMTVLSYKHLKPIVFKQLAQHLQLDVFIIGN